MKFFALGVLVGWLVEWLFYMLISKPSANSKQAEPTAGLDPNSAEGTRIRKENQALREQLELTRQRLAEKNPDITAFETLQQEKEAAQTTLQDQIDSLEGQLETALNKLAEREQSIKEAKVAASEESAGMQKTEAMITALQAENDVLREQITALEQQLAKAQEALSAQPAETPDDLTKIQGIGPKVAEGLIAAGIDSYEKLAKASADDLEVMLDKRNVRIINRKNISTWPKQATQLMG